MSKELSAFHSQSDSSWKEEVFPLIKDQIFEQLALLTNTDMRMSDQQKSGFMKCYWDLVAQEPSIEEMKTAQQSYIAHFHHIPSPFAYVKHFNRFRSGLMPLPKSEVNRQLEEKVREKKMNDWIKKIEEVRDEK
tara:strand:- start:6429 stop:6830 length:402 start_codon:yes stop_codon:yes gene_type:complete